MTENSWLLLLMITHKNMLYGKLLKCVLIHSFSSLWSFNIQTGINTFERNVFLNKYNLWFEN